MKQLFTLFLFHAGNANTIQYLALSLLLLIPSLAFGTCILIYRTDKEIFIAADSRRILTYKIVELNKYEEEIIDTYCKIRTYGKFTFCVAGFDDDGMHAVAKEVGEKFTKPEDIILHFTGQLKNHLTNIVEETRKNNLSYYKKRFDNASVADIAICYFDDHGPQVIYLQYNLLNKPDQPVSIDYKKDTTRRLTKLGAFGEIERMPAKTIETALLKNPVKELNWLISFQSKKTPQWVGGPIDILLIFKTGKRWLAVKKECKAS